VDPHPDQGTYRSADAGDRPEASLPRGVRTLELDDELLADIRGLIEEDARISLLNILADLHPADIADLIENVDEQGRRYLFSLLAPPVSSDVLRELDETTRQELLGTLSTEGITRIVSELESDDAADLVAELPRDIADTVLETIEAEDAAKVETLLRYPEDTAGGIMATEVLTVLATDTVKTAIRKAREFAKKGIQLDVLYVVDLQKILQGFLPVGDLILQGPGRRMAKVMRPAVSVKADLDQEEVANIIQKYDLVSVPVVNERDQVIGRITVDDVVDVLKEEATEDIERMAGLVGTEVTTSSIVATSRIRLPWLLVGFVGELLSAVVLMNFQTSLNSVIASAFFIPIIMAMGGNSGIQSSAIVVRGLATGEVRGGQVGRRLLKECGVAIINGLILSLFLFGVSYYWMGDMRFGVTAGLALLVVVANATVVGAVIPFVLDRFSVDPAIATGPFITTANDALGLLIYFGFITLLYVS
jgi:magnesium transporter